MGVLLYARIDIPASFDAWMRFSLRRNEIKIILLSLLFLLWRKAKCIHKKVLSEALQSFNNFSNKPSSGVAYSNALPFLYLTHFKICKKQ